MRSGLIVLAVCLLIPVAASTALAGDSPLTRSLTAQADEPWTPCAGQDYARSYGPSLATAPRQKWHVSFAAYLWATSITGTSYANGQATDLDIEFSDLFDKLESSFMGYAEVQYDRWSLAVDASFVSLEESWTGLRGVPVTAEVDQTILDFNAGYTVLCRQVSSSQWGRCCHPRQLTLDALVGARYWSLDQELTSTVAMTGAPVSLSKDETWWDPYVGARFRWQFAKRWGLSVYGDIGGFGIEDGSELTWKLQAMVRFHITRGFFVAAGYRVLDVDRVEGSGAAKNGVDANYNGPLLGLGYRF